MKKLLLAGAFVFALPWPLSAADMPMKAPGVAAPAAVFDWSGIYAGGHLGYQWDKISTDFVTGALPILPSHSDTGVGGFQLGAQKQFGTLVIGVEGGWTDPFSHALHPRPLPTSSADAEGATMKDGIWWVGGRAGLAMANWMPYVTGGWATAKFAWTLFFLGTPQVAGESRNSGPYVGGGLDFAVAPNWILGVEYRHYDFKRKYSAAITPAGAHFAPDDELIRPEVDSVLVRLSYKFGGDPWGKSPVVAKY